MSNTIIQTSEESIYVPRFEIEIDNKKLETERVMAITELTVEEKIGEGAAFSFLQNYEIDMESQERPWLDDELYNIGNKVNIKMGYDTTIVPVFMGAITGLETEFSKQTPPALTVRGQDLAYDYMKRKSPGRTFMNMSYSDIAQAIAGEAGLTAEVETTEPYEGVIRKLNSENYFTFLERLAGSLDLVFHIDGQTAYFIPPGDDKEEALILNYDKDISLFKPNLSTSQLCTEVEVRGHNPQDPASPFIGRAETGAERTQEPGKTTASQLAQECYGDLKLEITDQAVQSENDANALALAQLNKASDTLIQGDAECMGMPNIKTGMCVSIQKVGKRFSGKYYVTAVTHSFTKDGFTTRFTVKRNAL